MLPTMNSCFTSSSDTLNPECWNGCWLLRCNCIRMNWTRGLPKWSFRMQWEWMCWFSSVSLCSSAHQDEDHTDSCPVALICHLYFSPFSTLSQVRIKIYIFFNFSLAADATAQHLTLSCLSSFLVLCFGSFQFCFQPGFLSLCAFHQ